jgi:lipoprotein NlpD
VEDRSLGAGPVPARRPGPRGGGRHRVERGDTLYSIAFRNGLDYRELAEWNGIASPYTIYVGQELRLSAPARGPRPAAAAPAPPARPPARGDRRFADVPKPAPFSAPEAAPATSHPPPAPAAPSRPAAAALGAGATSTGADAAAAPAPPPKESPPGPAPTAPVATPPAAAGEIAWRWPADGSLVGRFTSGDPTRQGIDIAGKAGDPVRAAAPGTVVYSGNGLIGYGELIIVKHSPAFLSAYGHNRKRLVKEGDRVAAGQVIAEMGSSSASRDSLHFEIRRNGKPVDPSDYLPRR